MKYFLVWASLMVALSPAFGQTSPPETATGKIGNATLASSIARHPFEDGKFSAKVAR